MQHAARRRTADLAGAIFGIESLAFYALAALHLGVPLEVDVQPRGSVAALAALCGLAFDGAAILSLKRSDSAWHMGIAAHVLGVAAVLLIDMVLASPLDESALYRGFMAMAAVMGLLMMTTTAKSALGHPEPERKGRR